MASLYVIKFKGFVRFSTKWYKRCTHYYYFFKDNNKTPQNVTAFIIMYLKDDLKLLIS